MTATTDFDMDLQTAPDAGAVAMPDREADPVAFLDELEDIAPGRSVVNPAVSGPLPGTQPGSGSSDEPDLHAVYDVPVKVQAVLGRSRIPIGELLGLKVGMVIELDRKVGEPVDIFVNDRLIARGEVVLIDDMLGITLTEIVRQDR